MILQGNQRGGAKDLALHLLKDENDHVEVHELRGFIANDLVGALNEAHAISRGTKAKQFLFSLSLNPPANKQVRTEDFENAIARVEKELNLTNQPRAIVFHEKEGRRHCHCVWSRTDTAKMTAVPLPHTKRKLREISKELYLKHGWDMPRGFINSEERDPKNFTHAQWQQAKRIGKDPRQIKAALQDSWALSDTQNAFKQALKVRGFTLAKGDRRGFVAIDHACEIFSVSKKWIGASAKDVREKLKAPDSLPSVAEAKKAIASMMAERLNTLKTRETSALSARQDDLEQKRLQLVAQQERERQSIKAMHEKRWQAEVKQRQERYSRGLRGLVDRFTGKHKQLKEQNERETLLAYQRDRRELDEMIFNHLEQRQRVNSRVERLDRLKENRQEALSQDIQQYKDIQQESRKVFDFKKKMQSKQRFRGLDRER